MQIGDGFMKSLAMRTAIQETSGILNFVLIQSNVDNCVLEGVSKNKYENTYGVQQIQDGVKLKYVTEHESGVNVGSRLYVMDDDENYKLFYLKNREFSFEVDVSELQCGMNGAMYFSEMPANGGKGLVQIMLELSMVLDIVMLSVPMMLSLFQVKPM